MCLLTSMKYLIEEKAHVASPALWQLETNIKTRASCFEDSYNVVIGNTVHSHAIAVNSLHLSSHARYSVPSMM